tara:strand:- start:1629 stop:1787 length:159 start_codon:yes stop_codon:yes gene_type:complete
MISRRFLFLLKPDEDIGRKQGTRWGVVGWGEEEDGSVQEVREEEDEEDKNIP